MRRMGKIINIIERRIIVSSSFAPRMYSAVYDNDLKLIGWVVDVFGPVNTPYVRVKMKSNVSPQTIKGEYLYVDENRRLIKEVKRQLPGELKKKLEEVKEEIKKLAINKERIDDYREKALSKGYIPYVAMSDRELDELNIIEGVQP